MRAKIEGGKTNGRPNEPLPRRLCALAAQPGSILGRGRQRNRLDREAEENLRQGRRHLWPLVRGRRLQYLLQRARPPRAGRARATGGADLRFAGHQPEAHVQLRPPAVGSAIARRHAARLRRHQRRPRHPLHADGAGGGVRHAGLRAHRRHPFGGVRRFRGERTRHPHRRRQAESNPVGELRHGRRARHPLQAAARRGDQARQAQARHLPHSPAPAMRGAVDARPRPRLAQNLGARGQLRQDLRMRARARHRSALHSLHLGHDRNPERRGARQWRPHGRAQMVDAESLRRLTGRSVVVGLRRRLGGRPFLHRLCAAVSRLHLDPVRGQARGHARRRRVLARLRRPRRGGAVHGTHRVPRHPQGRPGRQAAQEIRSVEIPHAVSRRRARRSADHPMGGRGAQSAGDRPLVADRDRLVHRRQSGRPRRAAGSLRLGLRADAGLRHRHRRRGEQGAAA